MQLKAPAATTDAASGSVAFQCLPRSSDSAKSFGALSHLSELKPRSVIETNIIPIIQMKKLRLRKIKELASSHRTVSSGSIAMLDFKSLFLKPGREMDTRKALYLLVHGPP